MILQECALRLSWRGPLMGMQHATVKSQPSRRPSPIIDLRLAASPMPGPQRRAFEAEMPLQDGDGTPLRAEAVCGWGRQTVARGLADKRTGLSGLGAQAAFRGRKRWEEHHPHVAPARRQRADAHAQPDPTCRTSFTSTRLTAQAALPALRAPGSSEEQWPSPRTMAAGLNRMGLR